MKHLLPLALLFILFTSCDVPVDSSQYSAPEKAIQPYTIVASVAGPKNNANIRRIVFTVLVDSSYLDKIETHIMPSLVQKYDDSNMNQFLLYAKDPVDIRAVKSNDIVDVYKAAKKGSIALINKSAADDGIVMYEY